MSCTCLLGVVANKAVLGPAVEGLAFVGEGVVLFSFDIFDMASGSGEERSESP